MERIEEYNALREEILLKDTQFNEHRKYAYTVTTAVLAFSLTQTEPFICLLPILMIIPLFLLSQDNLRAMSKLGAYLRTFYTDEGMLWEKRNMVYHESIQGKARRKSVFWEDASIYIVLVFICGALSIYKTYAEYEFVVLTHQPMNLHQLLILNAQNKAWVRVFIILIVIIVSIWVIQKGKVYMDDERKVYIAYWEKIREEETIENQGQQQIKNIEADNSVV